MSIQEKKALLLANNVALWDVIASCEIVGSADNTIKNVCANDLSEILENSRIQKIFVNGSTAKKYYDRYLLKQTGMEAILLPSTSPANAAWSVERLIAFWKDAILN